jgi:hypothetical protein
MRQAAEQNNPVIYLVPAQKLQRSGKSQAEPRTRVRAHAKISVQSSEAKAFDQTASPAAMEIRGRAIFPGCAARATLKASLEKGTTERSNIGSNDVAADELH